jgi:ribosome-binding factor A
MAAPLRIQRLEQQVLAIVDGVLRREISDPRLGLVTITRAKLSRDLGRCEVYWSTLDEGRRRVLTGKALESARGFVQRELAKTLALRSAPHLEFVFDKAFEADARVQGLIGKAVADDEARRKAASPGEDRPA